MIVSQLSRVCPRPASFAILLMVLVFIIHSIRNIHSVPLSGVKGLIVEGNDVGFGEEKHLEKVLITIKKNQESEPGSGQKKILE